MQNKLTEQNKPEEMNDLNEQTVPCATDKCRSIRLLIGGIAQGKTTYALTAYGRETPRWEDFAAWFRERLQNGGSPEEECEAFLSGGAPPPKACLAGEDKEQPLLILADEIGSGIVPMAKEERAYRERYGHYLCRLAEEAQSVERLLCGLAQKLK